MVTLIGSIRANRLIEQPEDEVDVDKFGVASAYAVYECQWKDALRLAAAVTKHPEFPWLSKVRARVRRMDAAIARVTISFEGLSGGGTASTQREETVIYEMEASTTQEPIETHVRYESVTVEELNLIRDALKKSRQLMPLAISDAAFELYEKMLKGVTSYLNPGVTWKQTITKARLSEDRTDLRGLGLIDDSPPGPLPSVEEGRTWIRSGSTESIRGSALQVVNTWRLSGRSGWDSDLYGPDTGSAT